MFLKTDSFRRIICSYIKYLGFPLILGVTFTMCDLGEPYTRFDPTLQRQGPRMVRGLGVSAVIRPDGSVWTWGMGMFGTLGVGTLESSDSPVKAQGIHDAIAITIFGTMALSADKDGDIYFWGDNSFYSEQEGYDTIVVVPTIISHLDGVRALVVGVRNWVFFLRNDGTVWFAQHDHYRPTARLVPVQIAGLNSVIQISEEYAIRADGTLFDLIPIIPGQLSPPPNRGGPIQNVRDVVQLENVYFRRTVFLKGDGTVWAWGWNNFGQLGNGTFEDSEAPVRVENLSDIVAVSAHYDYTLALKRDGTVWFWGLENPTEKRGRNSPIMVQGLGEASEVFASYDNLVLCRDGTYWTFDAESRIPKEILFN